MPYDHPDAVALTELAQAFYVVLYGGPDAAPHTTDDFAPPNGGFFVGYLDERPIAMGGWRMVGHEVTGVRAQRPAEIKRMYVHEDFRRRGYARVILEALEADARANGVDWILLETGAPQTAAVGLYSATGYAPVSGFGFYADEPNARSFGKPLAAPPASTSPYTA